MTDAKRCARCGTEKPRDAFSRDARAKDGHEGICRACKSAKNAAWDAKRRQTVSVRAPIPMEDEPTDPGIPPPRLDDPSKPDLVAYNQTTQTQPSQPSSNPCQLDSAQPKIATPRTFKLLFIDIETAPILAWVWGTRDQNISPEQIKHPSRLLCFAAKWYGDEGTEFHWAQSQGSDAYRSMVRAAHRLLDAADAICHFNGVRFDAPRLNREFLLQGMPPPSPYKQIDLYPTWARFSPDSGKLAFALPQLGIGAKVKHEGFTLWTRCMDGDVSAWAEMERYCRGDVDELPAMYERLRPWIEGHPNLNLYTPREGDVCPSCASAEKEPAPPLIATTYVYKQWRCLKCYRVYRARARDKNEPVAGVR